MGLKIDKFTYQVEGVIALACSVESEEYCDEEVVGWYILISKFLKENNFEEVV